MTAPIAIQLYTLREALANDWEGVVRQLADIGYRGVETASFEGTTVAEARRLFDELGLTVPSAHLRPPVGEQRNAMLDTAALLGTQTIIASPSPEQVASLDAIKAACDLFNEASAAATSAGLRFGLHNHWWEFQPVEGVYPYQIMLERLDPNVIFEIDTYWVKTAGLDPVTVIREFGPRAPLLHIKDGPAVLEAPMVAVGQGTLDVPAIVAAAPHVEWLIVELDRADSDMRTAVRESYAYLVGEGLAHGTR